MIQVQRILLRGVSGVFNGERYLVGEGAGVTVGRSRSCDVSAARTRAYQRIGGHVLNRSRAFLKMSRKHFQVVFEGTDCIRVRDLSTNGVKVDGYRVQEVVFSSGELSRRQVLLSFGDGEGLLLCIVSGDAAERDLSSPKETTPSSGGHR